MNEYVKQANDFCKKYHVELGFQFLKTDKYFINDAEERDVYNITIKRNKGDKTLEYNFTFGDSMNNTEKNQIKLKNYYTGEMKKTGQRKQITQLTNYDVLSVLQKYKIGDFDDFICEYGYTFNTEKEYIKIKQLYFSVIEEYRSVCKLFNDCIEELQEIN